jgi:hypothetical protein
VTRLGIPRGGWVTFAGVVLLVAGILNVLDGIVVLRRDHDFPGEDLLFGDTTALGATWILIGAVAAVAGILVLRRWVFGQFLGIMVAGLNAFWHFLFIGADPARSILLMAVDGVIIYALTVHGEDFV